MKRKFIKMKYTTYLRIRRAFTAVRGESAANYFERLSLWLDERGCKDDKL